MLILLANGADINGRALKSQRTPLMWASFRNNVILMELLITKGADINLEDKEGLNCFDLAVCRFQYEAAHYLYKHHGMRRTEEERAVLYRPRTEEEMEKGCFQYREEFDVELFFLFMESDGEVTDRNIFFEKIRREYQEWLQKDLVVDTRESWR